MSMEKAKFEELRIAVYNLIRNASKKYPVKGKTICNELNLTFRVVKELITDLREEYPIVSKETGDGGYWIAESEHDILTFIKMIEARKDGYETTITKMKKYLNKFGIEDYFIN